MFLTHNPATIAHYRPWPRLDAVAARTENRDVELGWKAADFTLPDVTSGGSVTLTAYAADAPATLVVFMCNHCPFVIHLKPALVQLAKDYQARGVKVLAISSNSVETHPQVTVGFARGRQGA